MTTFQQKFFLNNLSIQSLTDMLSFINVPANLFPANRRRRAGFVTLLENATAPEKAILAAAFNANGTRAPVGPELPLLQAGDFDQPELHDRELSEEPPFHPPPVGAAHQRQPFFPVAHPNDPVLACDPKWPPPSDSGDALLAFYGQGIPKDHEGQLKKWLFTLFQNPKNAPYNVREVYIALVLKDTVLNFMPPSSMIKPFLNPMETFNNMAIFQHMSIPGWDGYCAGVDNFHRILQFMFPHAFEKERQYWQCMKDLYFSLLAHHSPIQIPAKLLIDFDTLQRSHFQLVSLEKWHFNPNHNFFQQVSLALALKQTNSRKRGVGEEKYCYAWNAGNCREPCPNKMKHKCCVCSESHRAATNPACKDSEKMPPLAKRLMLKRL